MQEVAGGGLGGGGRLGGAGGGEGPRSVCTWGSARGSGAGGCRSGGIYAGRRRLVGRACEGESLGRRVGERAPGCGGGPPRRGRRRAGGGIGRRGRLPKLRLGGRERKRRGECQAGRVTCACGRWETWRRGLLCLTWGPRALCGRGASESVEGRSRGVIAGGCAWQGGGESCLGRAVGGRGGVERGGGGVPGLPIVPPALECEQPALGMLYDAGGHRGEKGGVQGGGDGSERMSAAGIGVRDVHDGLQVVGECDCHGGVRAQAEARDADDAGGGR